MASILETSNFGHSTLKKSLFMWLFIMDIALTSLPQEKGDVVLFCFTKSIKFSGGIYLGPIQSISRNFSSI